jgi:hypothetical protein
VNVRVVDGLEFVLPDPGDPRLDRPVVHRTRHRFLGLDVVATSNTDAAAGLLRRSLGPPVDGTPAGRGLDVAVHVHDAPRVEGARFAQFFDEKYAVVAGSSFGVADCRAGSVTVFLTPADLCDELVAGKLLLDRLLLMLTLRRSDLYTFHGAAVGIGGRFALVAGEVGTGKSTFGYTCVRSGLEFLADDLVTRYFGDAPGRVWGHPGVTYLDSRWAAAYPELARGWAPGPEDAPKLRVDLEPLHGARLATAGELAALVFLHRVDGPGGDVEPAGEEDALELRYLCYAAESKREARIDADAAELVAGLPAVRLTVGSELGRSVAALRELLAGLRPAA